MTQKSLKSFYLTIFYFLVILPSFLFSINVVPKEREFFSNEETPDWVKPIKVSLDTVDESTGEKIQCLLVDYQCNWKEKAEYRHLACKALNQSGIKKASKIQIGFDPSYQKVQVHDIRVYRNGMWIDRLQYSQPKLIQREQELEDNLYNGSFTLLYFLNDIREGDIVEYSYSLIGHEPILDTHYTEKFYLEGSYSYEKVAYRLLISPEHSISVKTINSNPIHSFTTLSDGTEEHIWEVNKTRRISYEPNIPNWYNPFGYIEISEYKNWQEVICKISPLFQLPSMDEEIIPIDLKSLIETWKNATPSPEGRSLLALRFVQDEVRYLGIENGLGAYKPRDPLITFQQRFGDCKDKVLLLHALLKLLHIDSTPVLVHTENGITLIDALPSLANFNHVVLKININSSIYWVDPTIPCQGGTLKTCSFPSYSWGLELSNNSHSLSPLPEMSNLPTQIDSFYEVNSKDDVSLKIKSTFSGYKADNVRNTIDYVGKENFSQSLLSGLQEVYGTATSTSSLNIEDDRENNVIHLHESYSLPTWTDLSEEWQGVDIFSETIRNYLHRSLNPERKFPFSIEYPMWIKEHIRIKTPFSNWIPREEKYSREHESLFYEEVLKECGETTDYYLELKHLKNHIPVSSLRNFWEIANEIEKQAPYHALIVPLKGSIIPNYLSITKIYCLIGFLVFTLLYFAYRKNRLKQGIFKFYLNRFQQSYFLFYFVFIHLLFEDILSQIIVIVFSCMLFPIYRKRIASFNTPLKIRWLQAEVIFFIMISFYLFLFQFNMPIIDICLLSTSCLLNLGYGLLMLENARKYLKKEAMANSVPN